MRTLELLSPAKNCEQGIEAVNHGADAIYIGAPAFGARSNATNSIADIERLANYAHRYHARVFVTVNTLLFDDELPAAERLMHDIYHAGADAAIIQDMGLLKLDLPPIELHASTQTHNASLERIQFLQQVGFSRIILARETSLADMALFHSATDVELEAFVQGALCVSYSGQCYMSQFLSNRSGNRGCCGQPCRSRYDLINEKGKVLQKDDYLLSLKDFSAAASLQEMVDAGITSFKIEGRLKDMGYVKNVTAFYRQQLDALMLRSEGLKPSSSGHCTFFFTPDLEKTFNRGFTDYFLHGRQKMATRSTQKSIGRRIGTVTQVGKTNFSTRCIEPLTAGDGICFFDDKGALQGFYVNHATTLPPTGKKRQQGSKQGEIEQSITPNRIPEGLIPGTTLWRNHDQQFEKLLQGRSASRKIAVQMQLSEIEKGLHLLLIDSDGCQAEVTAPCAKEPALNADRATEMASRQLGKLGDTPFELETFTDRCEQPFHVAASTWNKLRRQGVAALEAERLRQHHRGTKAVANPDAQVQDKNLDYRANVINQASQAFYKEHGAEQIEYGLERTHDYVGKALMTTKYCLRHELGCCLKQNPDNWQLPHPDDYRDKLYLINNGNRFELSFDCRSCVMRLLCQKN